MVKDSLEKFIEDPGYDLIERKVKFKPDQAEKIHKFVSTVYRGSSLGLKTDKFHFFKFLKFLRLSF